MLQGKRRKHIQILHQTLAIAVGTLPECLFTQHGLPFNRRQIFPAALIPRQRLFDLWGPCAGDTLLGLGYALPVLGLWQDSARACLAAIPEGIGETHMPGPRGGRAVRVPEQRLPFADGVFDRMILLHALEEADNPRLLLREAWRVLAPEGRIIIATTNRKSLWSVNERHPFGHGRPWTRRQLIQLLNDGLFQVTASTTAVHMPPLDTALITGASRAWERIGELIAPGLGTEAVKASRPAASLPRNGARPTRLESPETPLIDLADRADKG